MEHLFSAGQIGRLLLNNRLIMPAIHLGMCSNGEVTQQLIDFYSKRAQGGVGLIIVGGCGIDDYGNAPGMIQLSDDKFILGLTELTSVIKKEGTKAFAQLYQAGRYAYGKISNKQPVAPSPIASRLTGEVPKELDQAGIDEVSSNFAAAALRAKNSGFDGVEILASAGYLICQFLSPLTNHRTDKYGGELENRMQFGLEVVGAVRRAVGPDYPVMVRVAGNDFMPGSNTSTEAQAFCQALEKAGVDAINVTGGWHETGVPQLTMNVPYSTYAYLARYIKEVVTIPVVACNRINDPELADNLLQEGWADFIGMARPLVADPLLPQKVLDGKVKEIRPCIGCNQGCLDNIFQGKSVKCLVNPYDDQNQQYVDTSKKILIIGGGPAGLEAARVASLRGHEVTIWEEQETIGGQLNLAAVPLGRKDFRLLINWYKEQLKLQRVKLILGKKAKPTDIKKAILYKEFDEIIFATGAKPIEPEFNIAKKAKIRQAWEVLKNNPSSPQKIIIVGGGAVGVETALYLAESGSIPEDVLKFLLANGAEDFHTLKELTFKHNKDITIVEMQDSIGKDIGGSSRWSMLADLKKYGVKILTGTKVTSMDKNEVTIHKNEQNLTLPCDLVILAVGSQSNNTLFKKLATHENNFYLIGDAHKSRKAAEAIVDGYRIGATI